MSFTIPLLFAFLSVPAPAAAEREGRAGPESGAVLEQPATGTDLVVSSPEQDVPVDGVSPLERVQAPAPRDESAAEPEETPSPEPPIGPEPDASRLPVEGASPFGTAEDEADGTPPTSTHEIASPLGGRARLTPPEPKPAVDPRAPIVRMDVLVGPVMRPRRPDAMVMLGLELGRKHGFSGTFHTTIIVAQDRQAVEALDFPIGLGAVVRGRLKNGLYGSVGLTAGILVHRARTDEGVTHRVDPDFRLPIGFGWSARTVGLSMAVVQGYSVRNRTYERRGATLWHRHAYRIGVVVGLHFDFETRRAKTGRSRRKRVKR